MGQLFVRGWSFFQGDSVDTKRQWLRKEWKGWLIDAGLIVVSGGAFLSVLRTLMDGQ